MPLRQAEISSHAWERFVSRWEGPRPPCYLRELKAIIAAAKEQSLGAGHVLRMLKHRFIPARYFIADHWRFVVDEELTRIMTIERPYIRPDQGIKKLKKHRRHG